MSVFGKAVLGLGFFCVLGLEPCVLDSTSGNEQNIVTVSIWNLTNLSMIGYGTLVQTQRDLLKNLGDETMLIFNAQRFQE